MFDTEMFKARLAKQLTDFNLVCSAAWALAPNVFVARIKEPDDAEWTFIFYYDSAEVGHRDERLIDRDLALLMMAGVTHGALSTDEGDTVCVTHFGGNMVGDFVGNEHNALNIATQLFTGKDLLGDGSIEVNWFDEPQRVR